MTDELAARGAVSSLSSSAGRAESGIRTIRHIIRNRVARYSASYSSAAVELERSAAAADESTEMRAVAGNSRS